ncbi:hypothetical protein DQP55_16110 [Mycolicibacterium sp. GF69]|nr:hypothetical protein DQP55_16110 [Mycolicibacterium sp. GF69]
MVRRWRYHEVTATVVTTTVATTVAAVSMSGGHRSGRRVSFGWGEVSGTGHQPTGNGGSRDQRRGGPAQLEAPHSDAVRGVVGIWRVRAL